jgi:hypothetical protein
VFDERVACSPRRLKTALSVVPADDLVGCVLVEIGGVSSESINDDSERLAAYHQLREMLSWLRFPLEQHDAYPEQGKCSALDE